MVMAMVYTQAGMYEEACEEIEQVLTIPSWYSAAMLKLDPIFEPLYNYPRFKTLIDNYEKEHGT